MVKTNNKYFESCAEDDNNLFSTIKSYNYDFFENVKKTKEINYINRNFLKNPNENLKEKEIFEYYNLLNNDKSHYSSTDDICTDMNCVKVMIDYIPDEFWKREEIKILDPCCGNGNFGAYCRLKTKEDNIWYNDVSLQRLANCKKILNPKNIMSVDALMIDSDNSWDLIMANPPYSGGANKNKSVSNKFIEKSIDLLKDKGYLCCITPNNWMTFSNSNRVLRKLLKNGSFLVIDNDAKKFFPKVGSSFVIMLWQKGVYNHTTKVINNFLIKDIQNVKIPEDMDFIPLYLSNDIISITKKVIGNKRNKFNYRCDLHNFTQKNKLSDLKTDEFPYETIHTVKKIRYAKIKQDIYDKWNIIVPLSTYYIPYIKNNVNTTQSVGYISFDDLIHAKKYLNNILKPEYKLIVHLTRYGNFNNIMVLKHLNFDNIINLSISEKNTLDTLIRYIKY